MRTDWIVIVQQVVGNELETHIESYWDGIRHATKRDAINAGARRFGHDDFNLGRLEGNQLTWFGWMDKERPSDLPGVARDLYLEYDNGRRGGDNGW